MNKGWFNNIARIVKRKKEKLTDPDRYFMVFERRKDKSGAYVGESPFPLTINEGDILQAKKKSEDLKGLVELGTISQAQADEICKYVGFEISIAPPREEQAGQEPKKEAEAKPAAKKNEADF